MLAPREPRENISVALDRLIIARDQGCCVYCGFNCFAAHDEISAYFTSAATMYPNNDALLLAKVYAKVQFQERGLAWPDRLWQRHHILAVSEGGLNTLENLVTACAVCHKTESSRLAARLAIVRSNAFYRPHVPIELFDPKGKP